MANCDINGGRLNDDCLSEASGVKTVFFFKHNSLNIVKNPAGEITEIGTGTIFRFEQDPRHGNALQEIVRGSDLSQYLRFQIDFSLFYMRPEYLETIDYLKRGLWAIFWLDYDDKIRLLGESTAMYESGGIEQSGKTAGENLYTNLSFLGLGSAYAPYLIDFIQYPFDNIPGVIVVPPYVETPGLLIYDNAAQYYKVDVFGNRLDYN